MSVFFEPDGPVTPPATFTPDGPVQPPTLSSRVRSKQTPGMSKAEQMALVETEQNAGGDVLQSPKYINQVNQNLSTPQRALEVGFSAAKGFADTGVGMTAGIVMPPLARAVREYEDAGVTPFATEGGQGLANSVGRGLGSALAIAPAGGAIGKAVGGSVRGLALAGGAAGYGGSVSEGQPFASSVGSGVRGAAEGAFFGKTMELAGKVAQGVASPIVRPLAAAGIDVAGNTGYSTGSYALGQALNGEPITGNGLANAAAEGVGNSLLFSPMAASHANTAHDVNASFKQIQSKLPDASQFSLVRPKPGIMTTRVHAAVLEATGKPPVYFTSDSKVAGFLGDDGRAYLDVNRPQDAFHEVGHAIQDNKLIGREVQKATQRPGANDAVDQWAQGYAEGADLAGEPALAKEVRENPTKRQDEGVAEHFSNVFDEKAQQGVVDRSPGKIGRAIEDVVGAIEKVTGTDVVARRKKARLIEGFVKPLLDEGKTRASLEDAVNNRVDLAEARDKVERPQEELDRAERESKVKGEETQLDREESILEEAQLDDAEKAGAFDQRATPGSNERVGSADAEIRRNQRIDREAGDETQKLRQSQPPIVEDLEARPSDLVEGPPTGESMTKKEVRSLRREDIEAEQKAVERWPQTVSEMTDAERRGELKSRGLKYGSRQSDIDTLTRAGLKPSTRSMYVGRKTMNQKPVDAEHLDRMDRDRRELTVATHMLKEGADPEKVRLATGWFKGVDEKWRHEISDADSKLKWHPLDNSANAQTSPEEYDNPFGSYNFYMQSYTGRDTKLGDVLHHPTLYKHYPKLADMPVESWSAPGAAYDGSAGKISVNAGQPLRTLKPTLLHEVQHAVQHIEGFGKGSSLYLAQNDPHYAPAYKQRLADLVNDHTQNVPSYDEFVKMRREGGSALFFPSMDNEPSVREARRMAYDNFVHNRMNVSSADFNRMDREATFDTYNRSAGEVEARDTAERQPYTDEQRRVVRPYESQGIEPHEMLVSPMKGSSKFGEVKPDTRASLKAKGDEDTISTRNPTAERSLEDPLTTKLRSDLASAKADRQNFVKNVESHIKKYPNFRQEDTRLNPIEAAEKFVDHAAKNIKYVVDHVPQEVRERAKLWYDGFRKIADRWAERYDKPPRAIAGVIAVLSPQKQWHMNVSLAERIMDTIKDHQTTPWSETMTETAARIFGKPQYKVQLDSIKGKRLSDLDDPFDKAMWIRTYDEAHNYPGHRILAPEGNILNKWDDGVMSKHTQWGSLDGVAKAVKIFENPTRENISLQAGEKHKVRNFYNNGISPDNPSGDVTIDTHAVAADLMRPLGGVAKEVEDNFGTSRNIGRSKISGIQGTYPFHHEAYNRAAKETGYSPRETQSIAWEGIRTLYTDDFKKHAKAEKAQIEGVWQDYRNGKITQEEAQRRSTEIAGGFKLPDWADSGGGVDVAKEDSTYKGELPANGLSRHLSPSLDGGGGSRRPRKVSPVNAEYGVKVNPETGEVVGDMQHAKGDALHHSAMNFFRDNPRAEWDVRAAIAGRRGKELLDYLNHGDYAVLTGENPDAKELPPEENAARNRQLETFLKSKGYEFHKVTGHYGGNDEHSYLVPGMKREDAMEAGKQFGQQSVLMSKEGLVYQDGKINPRSGDTLLGDAAKDTGFFSEVDDEEGKQPFSIPIDFDKKIDPATRAAFKRPASQKGQKYELSSENLMDKAQRAFQDEFLPVKRMQADLEKQTKAKLPENQDVYGGSEVARGKISTHLREMREKDVEPIRDILTKSKIDQKSFDDYLYARHAVERNAHVNRIDPTQTAGSGMSDADARQILQTVAASGKQAEYDKAASHVDAINKRVVDELEDSGMISSQDATRLRRFKAYVPLIDAEGKAAVSGSKPIVGRTTRAESPLTATVVEASRAFAKAEQNRVRRRLLELVQAHPDPDLWKVNAAPTIQTVDKRSGMIVRRPDPRYKDADNVVTAYDKGVAQTMEFKGDASKKIASALKRLNTVDGGVLVRSFAKAMRAYSQLQTNLNPDFLLPNLVRDVTAAGINLSAEHRKGMAVSMVKGIPAAWKAVFDVSKTLDAKPGSKYHDAMREYMKAGGRVDTYSMGDFRETAKRLQDILKGASPSTPRKIYDYAKGVIHFVDRINGATETATRLSAFVEARKAGMSAERATRLAKNLTVNFERKGELGPVINSLYMFSNASIQGNARMIAALSKTGAGRKYAAAIGAFGLAFGLIARNAFGEDEEGRNIYDTIPDSVKTTNLVWPTGGKTYAKIPLPHGYNSLFTAGKLLGEAATGGTTPGDAGSQLVTSLSNSFNPLGNSNSILEAVSPTMIDPLVEATMNKDFSGRTIVPESMGVPKPMSQRSRRDTSDASKAIAEWLNSVTGGDEVQSGKVDISPAMIDHWVGWASGGTGRFASRVAKLTTRGSSEDDVTPNDLPIVNRFAGREPRENGKDFYEARDAARDAVSDLKHYVTTGQTAKADRLKRDKARELSLAKEADAVGRQISKLNTLADQAAEKGDARQQNKLADSVDELMSAFVKKWRRATAS